MNADIKQCHDCKSGAVRKHCHSSLCPWVRCTICESISGYVYGNATYIPGPGREPPEHAR